MAGLNDEISTSSRPSRSARSATTPSATISVGSRSGSGALFLISMFTPMPAQASRASANVGTEGGSSVAATSTMVRPSANTAS